MAKLRFGRSISCNRKELTRVEVLVGKVEYSSELLIDGFGGIGGGLEFGSVENAPVDFDGLLFVSEVGFSSRTSSRISM